MFAYVSKADVNGLNRIGKPNFQGTLQFSEYVRLLTFPLPKAP
jgi:hypothetical protein